MARQKKTTLCPLGGVGVGGKWKFWIWYHLLSGTKRFGELQRLLPQASRQMLTIQLRELEHMGFLHRQVYIQRSPKVEYSLTELGWSLEPALRQMHAWGKWYGDQIGVEYDEWLVSLGGRWKFWIWYHLFNGPKRFGELQQLLPQANRQTLTVQLRELEQMGVLHRQAYAQVPPKVEYSLTELGQRSEPVLRQMYAWVRWCCEQIGVEYDWPVSDVAEERNLQPSQGVYLMESAFPRDIRPNAYASRRVLTLHPKTGSCSFPVENLNISHEQKKQGSREADSSQAG